MRRIKKATIKYISLCPRGANQMPVIYKADDGTLRLQTLVKADAAFDDNGELTAVVYAPEHRDSQGDIASAEVIKQMAYDFARSGGQIDIRHNEQPVGTDRAYVAENFIVQKDDPRFAAFTNYDGEAVDVTGAWAVVLKVEDPELRRLYKAGEWNGVSMGGTAQVETEKAADDGMLKRLVNALADRLTLRTSVYGDIEMTGDELKTVLKENNQTLVTAISEGIAKALKPEAPEKTETQPADKPAEADVLKFTGEPTVENLRKHRAQVQRQAIVKAIDWNDPASIEKAEKALAELDGDDAGTTTETAKAEDKDPEVARLEKELAVARKRSNAPDAGDASGDTTGLSKEDRECLKAAEAMTAHLSQ